jgi:hypothetical protein
LAIVVGVVVSNIVSQEEKKLLAQYEAQQLSNGIWTFAEVDKASHSNHVA